MGGGNLTISGQFWGGGTPQYWGPFWGGKSQCWGFVFGVGKTPYGGMEGVEELEAHFGENPPQYLGPILGGGGVTDLNIGVFAFGVRGL